MVARFGNSVDTIIPMLKQKLPRRPREACKSSWSRRGILKVIYSPCAHDSRFLCRLICQRSSSSISAANNGLASLRNVTQLRSALRVVGREQISSGTTVSSYPFLFSLHPFIAFFTIKDIDPDSLFSFLPKRLSGLTPVTVRIGHLCVIALFS